MTAVHSFEGAYNILLDSLARIHKRGRDADSRSRLAGVSATPAQYNHCSQFAPFISPRARAISTTGLAVWAVCKDEAEGLVNG
jgi:hypothetical protein